MLVFSQNKVDAVSIMKALNRYNGSDTEMRIEGKPFSITFLRSSATGTEVQDELQVEFVWGVPNKDVLKSAYNTLRSAINSDVRVNIGTVEFRAKVSDTTKFPPNTDLEEMLNAKFAISFNNVHGSLEVKAASKNTGFVFLKVPTNIAAKLAPESKDDLHLTITHLEGLNKDKIEKISKILEVVASNFSGFTVKINGSRMLGSSFVATVDCPMLSKFKDMLDENLAEIDPDMVSMKYPEYIPHVTVCDDCEDAPSIIKPIAWNAMGVCFDVGGELVLEQPFTLAKNEIASLEICEKKHFEGQDLRQAGYLLANELDKLEYGTSANALRTIVATIDSTTSVTRKIRLACKNIKDEVLVNRCIHVAEQLENSLDTRIQTALEPYVSPEKMDVALNAVLDVLNNDNDNEGGEVDGMGPLVPGTDAHIVTYTKAPQTIDIPSGAPKAPLSLEFSKRNF